MCDENDFPSICPLEDTEHPKDEYFQGNIIGTFSKDPTLSTDHLSKYELCGILEPFKIILDNIKGRSDQEGRFGYVVIEYFLESIKEESVQVYPYCHALS